MKIQLFCGADVLNGLKFIRIQRLRYGIKLQPR